MKNRMTSSEGFTLAELLIVVAIVVVLAAIAIPVFTGSLEKSRETTDVANVRSACSLVASAALLESEGTDDVQVDARGTYYVMVPLVQKEEDWQTESLRNTGTDESGTAHWVGVPSPGASAKVTCSADGTIVVYWNGYTPATVADNAKQYEEALNAVLYAIYDEIVMDRLASSTNHISWVLINGGKVTSVSCYPNENGGGQGASGLTKQDLDALNNRITQALEGTGYRLSTNSTARVFFDWNGNIVSNDNRGNKPGIGGQGANGSIDLMPTSSNNKVVITSSGGVWGL